MTAPAFFNEAGAEINGPQVQVGTSAGPTPVRSGGLVAAITIPSNHVGRWRFVHTQAAGQQNPIVQNGGGSGWKGSQVREPGNAAYDPAGADASRRWKLAYSGVDASGNVAIGMAFSPDGYTWTDHTSNPVVALGEDPYIAVNLDGSAHRDSGGLLHLFAESKTAASVNSQKGVNHFTSTDGATWTADAANPVFTPDKGTPGSFETLDQTSPVVWWDSAAGKFYMLYEGRTTTSDDGKIGVAWSTNGTTWTRSPNNPILTGSASYGLQSVVPDDFAIVRGKVLLTLHAKETTGGNYTSGRFIADSYAPESWAAGTFRAWAKVPFDTVSTTVMAIGGPGHYGRRWVYLADVGVSPAVIRQTET